MKKVLFVLVIGLSLARCSSTTPRAQSSFKVSNAESSPIIRIPSSANSENVKVSLTSEFHGRSEVSGHIYTLSQLDKGQWQLKDYTPCSSFPCADADQTTVSKYTPKLISELNMADGNTVVKLEDGLVLSFINKGMFPPKADGTREESYWQLEIGSEVIVLSFYPRLKIGNN